MGPDTSFATRFGASGLGLRVEETKDLGLRDGSMLGSGMFRDEVS